MGIKNIVTTSYSNSNFFQINVFGLFRYLTNGKVSVLERPGEFTLDRLLQGVTGDSLVLVEDSSQLRITLRDQNGVESTLVGSPLSFAGSEKPLGVLHCRCFVDFGIFVSAGLNK